MAPFEIQLLLQVGNANNDGTVTFADLARINGEGNVTFKAKSKIWNQNEVRFSGPSAVTLVGYDDQEAAILYDISS